MHRLPIGCDLLNAPRRLPKIMRLFSLKAVYWRLLCLFAKRKEDFLPRFALGRYGHRRFNSE